VLAWVFQVQARVKLVNDQVRRECAWGNLLVSNIHKLSKKMLDTNLIHTYANTNDTPTPISNTHVISNLHTSKLPKTHVTSNLHTSELPS
jgi:hypothetical protein